MDKKCVACGGKLNTGTKFCSHKCYSKYPKSAESLAKSRASQIGSIGYWTGKKRPPTSPETRLKISKAHKRLVSLDLHHLYKGGLTLINKQIRCSCEYRLWREAVFKRDNYTCVWCGAKNGNGKTAILNADHIKPFSQYPELRFAIDNGRTLCHPCHKKTDTYGHPKSTTYLDLVKDLRDN